MWNGSKVNVSKAKIRIFDITAHTCVLSDVGFGEIWNSYGVWSKEKHLKWAIRVLGSYRNEHVKDLLFNKIWR